MFRPIGSAIPDAVIAVVGVFFDKQQIHQFSLASPRANEIFGRYRMMTYTKIRILAIDNNKISIELQDIDDTKHEIHIDTDEEDITEKMAILLSTCHSIDDHYSWNGDIFKWIFLTINEKLMQLMLNIKIKDMKLFESSIMAPLPLFLKFLYQHGKILRLERVKLPNELVSNKTLSLISEFDVLPVEGTNLVVDVSDELLKGYESSFKINGFITKFTIKGISAFLEKDGHRSTSFGILASDQMQDALDFERKYTNNRNKPQLTSMNGRKSLYLFVRFEIGRYRKEAHFSINLNMADTDQYGMIPIPHNVFGIVAQDSFLKFNKIFSNPEELLPISQYQLERLSFNYYDGFYVDYTIRGENKDIYVKRTDVNLKDAHKIIVEILRNCTSIDRLRISEIKLDEDFYHLLKPIADNIHVPDWRIESALEPKSLREVEAANSGLFAQIQLIF